MRGDDKEKKETREKRGESLQGRERLGVEKGLWDAISLNAIICIKAIGKLVVGGGDAGKAPVRSEHAHKESQQ